MRYCRAVRQSSAGRCRRPTTDDHLAGLSDEAIITSWMGDRDDLAELVAQRVEGTAGASPTVHHLRRRARRRAVCGRACPDRGRVGGTAAEIQPVLAAAGLGGAFTGVVSADDVVHGKPHPEGYLAGARAARWGPPLDPARVVAFEDTEAGVAVGHRGGDAVHRRVGHPPACAARRRAADRARDRSPADRGSVSVWPCFLTARRSPT